jgi:hypothetical protein
MLLPLNLKTSKSVALSMDEIDSSFILTKAENENFFSPIAVFDFDAEFDTTGEDLLICLEEVLAKLKDEFN